MLAVSKEEAERVESNLLRRLAEAEPVLNRPAIEPAPIEGDLPDEPAAVQWDRIRSAFLSGRTPDQVRAIAVGMSDYEWLEWAVRMAPKSVKGELDIRHAIVELTVDKESYRRRDFRIQSD